MVKYGENLIGRYKFIAPEAAVLAVLFLRGPQTAGELRARTERLHAFASVDEVAATLQDLAAQGLVRLLPRRPGQKEGRYRHLLGGDGADEQPVGEAAAAGGQLAGAPPPLPALLARQDELEAEVKRLRQELADLAQAFAAFKAQFE